MSQIANFLHQILSIFSKLYLKIKFISYLKYIHFQRQFYLNNYKLNNCQLQLNSNMQRSIVSAIRALNIQINEENELNNGIAIAELINHIFYSGKNQKFINRIIKDNPERKGNNVLNMNIIMKQLKNDSNIDKPLQIQALTSFTLVEDKEKLNQFVRWILSNEKNSSEEQYHEFQQQYPRNQQINNTEENELANLYFASELSNTKAKFIDQEINDSLDDEPGNKVAKKGSFKLLRPKSDFPTQMQQLKDKSQEQPITLRQISNSLNKTQKNQNEIQQRKTIPKVIHKPPIYRQLNKQNTKARQQIKQQKHLEEQQPTPQPFQYHSFESSTKKEQIYKDIAKLETQIKNHHTEEKNISFNSQEKKRNRSRSIFKIEIKDVADHERKQIVQWLIHINLLNSLAVTYYANLHQICKNGVIFPEIINYLKGRGSELSYFKDPKRSAEMNSNYQKVFAFFKESKQFQNQLMFMYEYFIPQAQQKAFWSFLRSIYIAYAKLRAKKMQNSFDYDASIRSRLNKVPPKANSSKKPSIQNSQEQYKKIRYSSAKKDSKKSSRKNSEKKIQFVHEEIPETQPIKEKLVQNQEPIQLEKDYLMISDSHGYKDIYEKKQIKKYDTPKKNASVNNFSMSRSRIIMNSTRKSQQKAPKMPEVNLDMQMKAMRYLTDNEFPNLLGKADLQLFKDPFRNGTLINEIVRLQTKKNHKFISKPKTIEDCRNNFRIAFNQIKLITDTFPTAYEYYLQNIIKGEKALFYGFVYHISMINKGQKQIGLQKNQSAHILHKNNISNSSPYSFSTYFRNQNTNQSHMIKIADMGMQSNEYQIQPLENIMSWIRSLQKVSDSIANMRIRDMEGLLKAIFQQNFLYHFLQLLQNKNFITPNFHKAITDIQVESNLKKVISFMVQKKWISSDLLLKIRKIVRKDSNAINYLLKQLMHVTKIYITKGAQDKAITFVKYLKPQKENLGERLETTMANHSIVNPKYEENHVQPEKAPSNLEIKWLRKLGFSGDLRINNGVTLCQLLSRLTMKTIEGINTNPLSRAEALLNIRKAIKVIGPQFKWDENEILDANDNVSSEVYKFLKEKYKHAYALKFAQ